MKRKIRKAIQRMIENAMGNGLAQEMTTAVGGRYVTPGISEMIRNAGAESCVLLKSDGVLPFDTSEKIAVFGRCQVDWFYVGYGSGGDVHAPYKVNLIDGLRNAGAQFDTSLFNAYVTWTQDESNTADDGWWGHWPFSYPEMPLSMELVEQVSANAGTSLCVIGRAAGEDRENTLTKGSYYLTDAETAMLDAVTAAFEKTVVVMNVGSIMDMSWMEKYGEKISALLIVWQGGMESGNAVADVLYGKVNPCGKLPDTIARHYEDYPSAENFGGKVYNNYAEGIFVGYRYFDRHPEKVLFPFGFGLSYTLFNTEVIRFARGNTTIKVTNIGDFAGKEVVTLFCHPPKGRLTKAERVLVAFAKTENLLPGESEELTLCYDDKAISSYDETSHAFVLEAGEYRFEANGMDGGVVSIFEKTIVEQCHAICSAKIDLKTRILEHLPKAIPQTGDRGITLQDVKKGTASLDSFIAQLSNQELEALSRGHGMMGSALGVAGNAGTFGGILPSLRGKGIDPVTCCDGPAGLRMHKYCSLIPCGTALAATWNEALVEQLHTLIGKEMVYYGADVQLAPGMNIHRNPLCGRNFEYFSEDPLLSGKIAASAVRGIQSTGKASCPKHFACNNQETKRNTNDSRVSEQALREIYLRNFEIVIKEAKPLVLMTSYNKVNGVWSHYNYDLATTVLRKEWNYEGTVITDWWMRKSKCPEFPRLRDNGYRVRAQVDVLMPGNMGHTAKEYRSDGTLLKTLGQPEGITLGELQRTAKNALHLVMKLNKRRGNDDYSKHQKYCQELTEVV